tara:strand:- start:929 stop:1660 length:732 start_codon:yes stop_codon:yes gene_type:complete
MSQDTMSQDTMSQDTISQDTISQDIKKTNQKKRTLCSSLIECEIFCICFVILFMLGLVVSFMAAFVVWIVALIEGKNLVIRDKCPENDLWEWLLVFGIVMFMLVGVNSKKKNNEKDSCFESGCKICCNIIAITCSIVLCWWGNEQFEKDNNCMKEKYGDTLFYKTAISFWWFHFVSLCIVTGILTILIAGLVVYLVIMNCKCGRILIAKISTKKDNSQDDLIVDIMGEKNNNNSYATSDFLEV